MIYPWYTDTLQRQEAPRHHDRAENSFLQSGIKCQQSAVSLHKV